MRIEELKTFVAVVESGGLTEACSTLGASQSTVSDRITTLERYLGQSLLQRRTNTHALRLTTAGERLLPIARKMVALADQLMDPRPQTSVVRLGVNESVAHTWFFSWLACLRAELPSLAFEVTVETTDALEQLMAKRRLDLAAAARGFASKEIKKQKLAPLEMAFVGHSRRHTKKMYALEELAREGFVTFSVDTQPHSQLLKLLKQRGLESRVDRVSSIAAILMSVEEGLGVATLPSRVLEGTAGSGLRVLPCSDGVAPLPVWTSWRDPKSWNGAQVIKSLSRFLAKTPWLNATGTRSTTLAR